MPDPLVERDGAGRVLGVDAEPGRALAALGEAEKRVAEQRLAESRVGATAARTPSDPTHPIDVSSPRTAG